MNMIKSLLFYGIGLACIEIGYRTCLTNFIQPKLAPPTRHKSTKEMRAFIVDSARNGSRYFDVMDELKKQTHHRKLTLSKMG